MASNLSQLAKYTAGYAAFSMIGNIAGDMKRALREERIQKMIEEDKKAKEAQEYNYVFGEQAVPMIKRVISDLVNMIVYLDIPMEETLMREAQSIIDTMNYLEEQTARAKGKNNGN